MPILGSSAGATKGPASAPTIGTGSGGSTGVVSVPFTAPSFSKLPITSYTVTSSSGQTGSGASSPITVNEIAGGTYTYTVRASHANGQSAASSASNGVASTFITSTVDYLVVAGGGSGNYGFRTGGGGAGGMRAAASFAVAPGTPLTVTVGGTGSNSVFSSITSTGGGNGSFGNSEEPGTNGGSGGGGSEGQNGGLGIAGQGNNGGGPSYYSDAPGCGGGGAVGVGGIPPNGTTGGPGGAGLSSSITGTALFYAGGGGGGKDGANTGGTGGSGVGGTGGTFGAPSIAPTVNRGGGGGGAGPNNTGTAGASGVVVIAYPNSFAAPTSISAGLTYDQPSRSGYRVYRFTGGTGTVTF